ncbi:MAG TPA: efflux RND transporter periplasmic adaptor subunit [Thermoanaerobaculia bacterium]|nr:efflux RND transporter periplasmic adaptor subunit [Thermoanaerobaculia bacterium]
MIAEPIPRDQEREAPEQEEAYSELEPPRTSARPTRKPWWRRPEVLVAALAIAIAALALTFGRGAGVGDQQPEGFEPTPVRTAAVALGELEVISTYAGELVGEVSDIASQVSGLLEEVPFRIGDRVARGEVIAVIDDLDLRNQLDEARGQVGVAAANTRRAEAELESIQAEYKRAEELYRQSLISDQEFERVRANLASARATVAASEAQAEQADARLAQLQRQLSETRVVAPFDGTVAARYLDRGTLVQPNTPILRLVEAAPLVVQFRVPERDLGSVRPGVSFTATTQATGDQVFAGTVRRVSGEVSRTDRTAIVEGELQRGEELLRPGMYAEVEVRLRAIEGEVVVPGNAVVERVQMDGTRSSGVFTVAPAGDPEGAAGGEVARWVDVEVLGQSQGRAAIRGEVAAGDTILTLGHAELRDGAPIRVVQREGVQREGVQREGGQRQDGPSDPTGVPTDGETSR